MVYTLAHCEPNVQILKTRIQRQDQKYKDELLPNNKEQPKTLHKMKQRKHGGEGRQV